MSYTKDELEHAKQYPSLGAKYKRAQNIVDELFGNYGDDVLKPVIEKACDDVYSQINDVLADWLFDNACNNFRNKIEQAVEDEFRRLIDDRDPRFISKDIGLHYKQKFYETYKEDLRNDKIKELEDEIKKKDQLIKRYEVNR